MKAAPNARTKTMMNFLTGICHRWGYPEEVITDNGMPFRSNQWERLLRRNHITSYFAPIYHQRANPVERRNQEIKKLLRVQLRGKAENSWDEQLGEVAYILHNRANAATGQPPSQLLFGAPLARPGEWGHPNIGRPRPQDERARERRLRRARRNQEIFQRRLYPEPRAAPLHFQPGNMVLVRAFPGVRTPFGVTWEGPYPVIAVRGENVYEIDRNGAQDLVHLDDIRPAPGPPPDPLNEPDVLINWPDEDRGPEHRELPEEEERADDEANSDIIGAREPESDDQEPDEVGGDLVSDEGLDTDGSRIEPPVEAIVPGDEVEDVSEVPPNPDQTLSRVQAFQNETVLVEDLPEPDIRGCQHSGIPIVGLWP